MAKPGGLNSERPECWAKLPESPKELDNLRGNQKDSPTGRVFLPEAPLFQSK